MKAYFFRIIQASPDFIMENCGEMLIIVKIFDQDKSCFLKGHPSIDRLL